MFNQTVLETGQFPVHEKNRKNTDVICTIIGAVIVLTVFIVAIFTFSKSQLDHKFYGDQNTTFAHDHQNFKGALWWIALAALAVGLLWMTMVNCIPRKAPLIAVGLGAFLLLAFGVLTLVLKTDYWGRHPVQKIIAAVLCFILFIIFVVMICVYKSELRLQGIFLDYARRFLNEHPNTYLYIPLFMLFAFIWWVAVAFMHAAFAKNSSSNNYYNPIAGGFWSIFTFIVMIFGFEFLRDAFNFCVSGSAVDWYWTGTTSFGQNLSRLFCRNWGSVVAGSIFRTIFRPFKWLAELVMCHTHTCCSGCGSFCEHSCGTCCGFFNLVRTDSYSYINLSGISYCNSGRQCEKLCTYNPNFVGSHSPMEHYRFNAHVTVLALLGMLAMLILNARMHAVGFWHAAAAIYLCYTIVTWFIGIHADAAEGIQTSFFAEHYASEDYKYMQRALPSFRKEVQANLATNKKRDGNC